MSNMRGGRGVNLNLSIASDELIINGERYRKIVEPEENNGTMQTESTKMIKLCLGFKDGRVKDLTIDDQEVIEFMQKTMHIDTPLDMTVPDTIITLFATIRNVK